MSIIKDNIGFFSHETDADENRKILILRGVYGGLEGWAMVAKFWALNCLIGKANGCRLDLNQKGERARVARYLDLSLKELEEYLSILRDEAELIRDEGGVIWTEQTQEDLDRARQGRTSARERKALHKAAESPQLVDKSVDKSVDNFLKTRTASDFDEERIPENETKTRGSGELVKSSPELVKSSGELVNGKERIGEEYKKQPRARKKKSIDGEKRDPAFMAYCLRKAFEQHARDPERYAQSLAQSPDIQKAWASENGRYSQGPPACRTPCECGGMIRGCGETAQCVECGAFYIFDHDAKRWQRDRLIEAAKDG